MSGSQGSPNGSFSPWWALLALPVAALLGVYLGGRPVPARAPAPAAPVALRTPGPAPAMPAAPAPRVSAAPAPAGPEASPRPEPPPGVRSSWTTIEGALAESQRNGKPVMLDFNADWCPPCQRLKREVFDDGARAGAVQTAVIPVSVVDRMREEGRNPPEVEELQRRFGVDAFPTLVVFNPRTGRGVNQRGYRGADATVQWIAEAAASVR
jgi:thiol-disulfide isomerase/thioredoxin